MRLRTHYDSHNLHCVHWNGLEIHQEFVSKYYLASENRIVEIVNIVDLL